MHYQWKQTVLIMLLASSLALVGCSKDVPTGPIVKDQDNQVRQAATTTGIEVFRSLQTFNQIEQTLVGPNWLHKIKVT